MPNIDNIRDLAKETIGIQMIIFFPATYIFIFLHYEFWLNCWGLSPAPIFKNSMFYLATFLFFFIIYNFLIKRPKFKKLKNDFHSDEMDEDMKVVNEWLKENDIGAYNNSGKIDDARRSISKRYNAIYEYYKDSRFKKEIKEIIQVDRIDFLLKKIDPFEKRIEALGNGKYVPAMFLFFKKFYEEELLEYK